MPQFHSARVLVFAVAAVVAVSAAQAQQLYPGNLVVSRSVYTPNTAVTVGEILPPGCTNTTGGCAGSTGAIADSTYPYVFNNDTYDGSFGIASKILLDQITPFGWLINTREVPNSTQRGVTSTSDQLVTSFPSKSELGLHLSLDRKSISFMGYVAPVNTVDASNSNTPGAIDLTNPVGENFYRAVATIDAKGHFTFSETNAYSGNNGRSAIYNPTANIFYTAGNAGNGGKNQPSGVVAGAGAQLITHASGSEYTQNPGNPTPLGSFSVTQLGDPADKIGKDDNFRGVAVYNNVVYFTKGSGGNGVNTVYFVDTTGTACPNGVGLPAANAALPTTSIPYDINTVGGSKGVGLTSNMCILKGFPTSSNKAVNPVNFPFGMWFANPTTLYVADEGDGFAGDSTLYTHAGQQTLAGLQKWVFNSTTQSWTLAYTLQNGLSLGTPYAPYGYPAGDNTVTGLPWAPTTDGLRNITGKVLGDNDADDWDDHGTWGWKHDHRPTLAVVYAVSSTVSGGGDTGADPNRLFVIVDDVNNTDPAVAVKEKFFLLRAAKSGEVLRGVSFTPETAGISSF